MAIAVSVSICLAGVFFMVRFFLALYREHRPKRTRQVLFLGVKSAEGAHPHIPVLGATYEYQEAVLRWPLRHAQNSSKAGVPAKPMHHLFRPGRLAQGHR
jgi:hypothetical protein